MQLLELMQKAQQILCVIVFLTALISLTFMRKHNCNYYMRALVLIFASIAILATIAY